MNYDEIARTYELLESTPKRLEKTNILSNFLKKTKPEELEHVVLLVQGKTFPDWDERKTGMASQLLLKALSKATGAELQEIEKKWKETGDLGRVAEELVANKKQATLFSQKLSSKKVFDNLRKLAEIEGTGTIDRKIALVSELLTSASPLEAKYIIRTVLGELRIGLGEGTLRDAIVWAFFAEETGLNYDKEKNEITFSEESRENYNNYVELVQSAYDIANDFSEVAVLAAKGPEALSSIELKPGKPVKVMLYQKAESMKEAFETVGRPAAIEQKYDGFRLQLHKNNKKITLFTRRLENVTKQFPEVTKMAEEHINADSYIIDCEAVGFDKKTGKYLPFQNISQRIKRKYDIAEMSQKFPVEINLFDILFINGKSTIKLPFIERRKILESALKNPCAQKIRLAEQLITADDKEAEEFYQKSLAMGNEGVMFKNLNGTYKPGSRVGYGVKLKPIMETLDAVIVGAEWGEGKRAEWLASFTIAVRNPETNELLEIGKVGTGFKEKDEEGTSFKQLTEMLKPLITEEKGREVRVRPEIVIEVAYEEIQASPTYSSGFALRFPRLIRLREDKSPEEASTIDDVKKLAEMQRGRNH